MMTPPNQIDESCYIDEAQLRAQLELMKGHVLDNKAGIFGPNSMFWQVNKYSSSFVGAGRAVLLQTAHPWVANAIKQHSKTMSDPIGRFRRTFTNVFAMMFGSVDQVIQSSIKVHNIHASMFGKLEEQSGIFGNESYYQANEVHSMIWVHATLWEGAVKMYELVVGPLTKEEKEQYYKESKMFAYCFGIPESALPPTWDSFLEYNEWMWNSNHLYVGEPAKEIAHFLFRLHPLLTPVMNYYKVVTSMMLPERVREMYDFPPATEENMRTYERFIKNAKTVFPYLPRRLQYLSPYVEAHRRIKGKSSPDLLTGAMNKLVLGQAVLVS